MLALYIWLKTWMNREEGQDLIEYALLVVFIAVVLIAVLPGVGTAITGVFTQITSALGS